MSLWRVLLLALKETRHVVRDPRTLYMALGVPLVLLLLFGYALSTDVEDVRLLVVDQDRSSESRALVRAFEGSGLFRVVGRPASEAELSDRFYRGEARCALLFPPGYGRHLARGEEAAVQFVLDGTNANDASIAQAYAQAIVQQDSAARSLVGLQRLGVVGAATPLPELRQRNWFNPRLRSQWYLVPGLVAIILAMVNTILMALTVAREWERGTMEQLLVTPARMGEIVLGKLLPYFFIGLGQLVLVAAAGLLLYDVPLRGSLPLLFAASSLAILAALGQGLLISVLTRNQQVAMQLSILSSVLPALLLSGFMSPIASMPPFIQGVSRVVPARHFLVVLRGVFLKAAPVDSLLGELAALGVFAAVLLLVATLRSPRSLD